MNPVRRIRGLLRSGVDAVVKRILGRRFAQSTFEHLHRIALAGMNIGDAPGNVETSGEDRILADLARQVNGRRPIVVFDVGANVGDYAQQVLSHLGGTVVLHVFEPSAVAFASLEKRFGSQRNAILHNIGLGSIEGDQPFYGPAEGSPLSSVHHRRLDHFGIEMKALGTVRMRTLDSFCSDLGLEHINLLKLDVEGNEFEVLRGAGWLLANSRIERIQFEFGGSNIDSRTFLQDFFYLLNERYRLFRIIRDGLWPIEPYRETHEIFVTWNVLAVLRQGSEASVPGTGRT